MNRKERRTDIKQRRPMPQTASQAVAELFAAAHKFSQAGCLDETIHCFRKAVRIAPDFAPAHYNLGNALGATARGDEAIACFRKTIELAPSLPEAHCNLGATLKQQRKFGAAAESCRKAIELAPDFALAHFNLGTIFEEQRRLDEAGACYRTAIRLQPQFAEAHLNLAMTLLTLGEMEAGWQEYEWRWKTTQMSQETRGFRQPQWRGEAGCGRTLLIHAEQGFGDTLQFCRYAALAAARGFRVVMEVPKPLVGLLRGLSGIHRIFAAGEALPLFDVHAPMLSLPLAFATNVETIPGNCPYLLPDQAEITKWRSRLAAMPGNGPRIGLVWAGNSRKDKPDLVAVDQRRSIAVERLAPMFGLSGLRFFSLQKDQPSPASLPLIDLMTEIEDFAGTAALIANLDLVISVDTSVAHLAGALAKPIWLLNRFDSDWRWMTGRHDSPWYPTMRLYNQLQPDHWDSVIAEVTQDLNRIVSNR